MQREEKQLDSALEVLIQKVNDLKSSIAGMLLKLEREYDTLNWPTFLDNFALISGQLCALSKVLRNEKTPILRNLVVLPLHLSPDRDEELVRMTENRVNTFAHDLVPDYLRTKPDPEAEHKMLQLEQKAANISQDNMQKQVNAMNKVVTHVMDVVGRAREEWESDASGRTGAAQTSSVSDTSMLVAAIGMGKGLKMMPGRPGPPPNQMPGNQQQAQQMGSMNKAPSAIKTNIKAAAQVHPYAR